ncbi:MAG: TIGR03000 domain-containing protein [Pirellulaceae bacterium]
MRERSIYLLTAAALLATCAVSPLSAQPAVNGPATVVMTVPADAKVFINDRATTSRGTTRTFYTPRLLTGRKHTWKVRIEATRGAGGVIAEQSVVLIPGRTLRLDFSFHDAAVEEKVRREAANVLRLEGMGAKGGIVRRFGDFRPVSRIDFREGEIGPEALDLIPKFKGLRSLVVKSSQITDDVLRSLAEHQLIHTLDRGGSEGRQAPRRPGGDSEITQFDLSGTPVSEAGLEVVAKLPNLEVLTLDPEQVNKSNLQVLKSGAPTLSLHVNEVTDSVLTALGEARQIHMLGNFKKSWKSPPQDDAGIVYLRLADQPITDKGLSAVAGLENLETLDLSNTQVTGAGLRELKGLDNLQWLALQDEQITDDALASLRDADLLHTLPDATANGVAGLYITRRAVNTAQVNGLKLDHTAVSDAGLKELRSLTDLQFLSLKGVPVTSEGLRALQGLDKLQVLSLDSDELTDLKGLEELTELRLLNLGSSPVAAAELEVLKKLPKLEVVTFSPERVTDAVLAALEKSDLLQSLVVESEPGGRFTMSRSQAAMWWALMKDKLAPHVKPFRPDFEVVIKDHLDLSGTQITDAGLKHLHGLKHLKSLDLEDTQVTAAGVRAIKAELPDCRIGRPPPLSLQGLMIVE